ncbi:myelin-associated glycoprotein-like [Clarias gariepinus]|uniref:myelin-associated glycoprotein-like n=1 Tax=Clarias gariepinus TaxID=13013 RepID=UPI00234D9912|nr:myelin-associated glycoprotein-like [Clarias gariepinus]
MKNCTTVFYNISESDRGVYYFRIETSGILKYSYTSPTVSVRVRDSPISPSIRLYKEDQGEVEDLNEVVEGTSVRIICSAPALCSLNPPTFTWNFLPEERKQEQNHNTSFSSSQLYFNATHLHHGQDFTCTATYWLQNKNISVQSSLTLHVLCGPRNTSVSASPSALVVWGSSVSLSCSSDANPAVLNYTWYRENREQIGTGDHLTINTTDSTHSGLYYCRAQNQYGDHNSSVYLHVSCTSYKPLIRLYMEDQGEVENQNVVMEGTSVRLSCSAPVPPCFLKPSTVTRNFLPEERRQEQNHNNSFNSSQLNFNATHLDHEYNFICTANYWLQNKTISVQSSLTLHVLYGPRNTSAAASPSASLVLGSSVSLSCSSDGNPAMLNYTWYRENGEQIGTGNHLTINTTDSTHSGLYYCRAQNQLGDHNSSVYLDVQYGPRNTSVSVSPSASVVLGSSVSLSCSSDANPAVLNYTWYRENGEQIGTGNHLTINTTDSTHSCLYYCRAQNQHGDHNSSVYLDVQYGPSNTSAAASPSASLVLGSSVSLSCSSDGNPAMLNYTWYRENGEQIGTGNHLTINTTDSTHSGLYYCRAQNQHGDHNSSVYLDVQYGPRDTFVLASPSASVVLGSSVSLSCSSDANPAVLNYTWYRENREQIGTGNHLTFNTTDSTHSGLYHCRAQNQHGDHNSSVYLDVQFSPQVSLSSSCNSTQNLIKCFCEAHGNPYPKLEWHLTGHNLSNTTEESVNNTTVRSFISIHQTFTTILTLHCIGSNRLGFATQLFYFEKVPHHSAKGVCIPSLLIGAAAGATLIMMLCGILLRVRRVNPSWSGQENIAGFNLNAVRQEYEEEDEDEEKEEVQSVYVNRQDLSDLLHYSTIKFSSRAECDIKGASSLTAEYASVYHGSKQQNKRRITDTEDKDRDPENLEDSDEAKEIYTEVKCNKHKGKV